MNNECEPQIVIIANILAQQPKDNQSFPERHSNEESNGIITQALDLFVKRVVQTHIFRAFTHADLLTYDGHELFSCS